MTKLLTVLAFGGVALAIYACKETTARQDAVAAPEISTYDEPYRPQFHFTPKEKWMNDPNGLVYNEGLYHLFFQYYPGDIVWGPMHWGHAVSKDLVFWEHRPIALFPDENGYIFSGSAVVDSRNSSGFGTSENPALVAIFTYHNLDREKAGMNNYQTQGIAYSLDNGASWIKYGGNPVIENTELYKDFRDPKVFWHEESGQWVMVLVAGDHAQFYRSANLKEWEYMSSFGKEQGAHGGVWECPDLFPLKGNGEGQEKWVLIISINPGAPNGGSGTQYFVGDFDGTSFTSKQQQARWMDWGRDNYAGVTFNNVPSGERIFIGWMSNWDYAAATPTEVWRSAMTLPRKLTLQKRGDYFNLENEPLEDLGTILKSEINRSCSIEAGEMDSLAYEYLDQSMIRFRTSDRDFRLAFTNQAGDTLLLEMQSENPRFLLDRSASGETEFDPKFINAVQQVALENLPPEELEYRIWFDWSSIEIFINSGQYSVTSQVFPTEHYSKLLIENTGKDTLQMNQFELSRAESIWTYTPE